MKGHIDGGWKTAVMREVRASGGVRELGHVIKRNPDLANGVIESIAHVWVEHRSGRSGKVYGASFAGSFTSRVCATLRFDLRHLRDSDLSPTKLEQYFLRAVDQACGRALVDWRRRSEREENRVEPLPTADTIAARSQSTESHGEVESSKWWDLLDGRAVSIRARLELLLSLVTQAPGEFDALCDDRGRFDTQKLAAFFGVTGREVRRVLARMKKQITKATPMVPRPFRKVYQQLSDLAAGQMDGLAALDLRQTLFDLSRSLAASFDPAHVDAQGARKLRPVQFHESVDLLLSEREFTEAPRERSMIENIMQLTVSIREALERDNVEEAFVHASKFVLEAARLQPRLAPERLQTLLAYAYFLKTAGWHDAWLQAMRAVERQCAVLVEQEGEETLDAAPQLERSQTLRRIRTFARANRLICLFYEKLATPRGEHFRVPAYDALASLADEYDAVLADDIEAATIWEDALVVRAHVCRAAHNRFRRAKAADKRAATEERAKQRGILLDLIKDRFWDAARNRADTRRIVEAARNAGEDHAADRTLDVVEEVYARHADIVDDLSAQRLAASPIAVPE